MDQPALDETIVDHALNPRHYGALEEPDAIGVGVDPSGVYLMFYLNVEDAHIKDIGYATSGSQDAITLASMMCEMTLSDSFEGITETLAQLESQVEALYAQNLEKMAAMRAAGSKKKISLKEQDNASMVIAAMRAALINFANRTKGIDEEQHRITIELRGGDNVKRGCSH